MGESPRYVVSGCFPGNDHRQLQQTRHVSWSSEICHCSDDLRGCWTTFFCPCVTFGRITEDAEESSCVKKGALYCLAAALTFGLGACCCGCYNRSKMRKRFNLGQNRCADCSAHFLCHCCALCQEYRHLQGTSFYLVLLVLMHATTGTSSGWEETGQMRNGPIEMTPPPPMRM
ncbi:hypothetical protein ACJRO7_031422 [Eucalyptus globulus]|uniref:Uncharacterized protein n=1 Tax=Eucalyptus globulus TaxID=34317 RepID=A0ABD3JQC0_EUCGL